MLGVSRIMSFDIICNRTNFLVLHLLIAINSTEAEDMEVGDTVVAAEEE